MRKYLITIISLTCLLSCANADARFNYDPTELQKFLKTGNCPGCNLTSVEIDLKHPQANLIGANLSNSSLNGDLAKSDFSHLTAIRTVFFAKLPNTNFSNAILRYAAFLNSDLSQVDFTAADLRETKFDFVDVTGAKFDNANLVQSNITAEQLAAAASVCNALLPDGEKGKCK